MEKKTGTMEPEHTYSGSMDTKVEKVKKAIVPNTAIVRFKANRKYDLHIGRDCITFMAYEKKEIPLSWLSHRDWDNAKKYFDVIKGE